MLPGLYIYKKEVDWSALHEGLTIPVTKHGLFYDKMNLKLKHGERRTIKLLIDGQEFQAELINQGFDRTIGESLKWLYDNRCQICDLAIG